MKISSRFWLAGFTPSSLIVAVSLVLLASSRRFSAAEAKREEITGLLQQINALSHLTIDYLLQPSPGVKQQWLGVQEDLMVNLRRRPFTQPERVVVITNIQDRLERMGTLFEDMTALAKDFGAGAGASTELQREKYRVIGSFLQIAMHEVAADIIALHALADGDVAQAEVSARSLVLVLVLTAGLVVCGVVFTLYRSVVGPLAALHRGVAAVSAGDLGYRFGSRTGNEIGDLARSFDSMLDELQKRDGEISAANAELRLHREHLERLVEERTLEVRKVGEHLAAAQAMAQLGSWEWDAAHDVITGSAEFYRIFGVAAERLVTYADFNTLLHPGDREHVRREVEEALARRAPYQTEYRVVLADGGCRQIQARGELAVDDQGRPAKLVGTCLDITERKQGEEALRRVNADLERSNRELEQFAYVASHDLQEPLRMVASYTQLLAQRYGDQLDEKARKYIDYAVDGAVRMQGLINDLLAYSRIGSRGTPLAPTDARAVLGVALQNLAAAIAESGAIVTRDELPVIRADASQLALVFQNLIGNAVKFRGEREPRVHVGAADVGNEWVFSVKDNGIGIEAQYAERIFVIFQRLHTREEYPGTGIGLAVCKRIVERHGGRIWFESEPGQGSTFFFSIPK